MTASVVIEQPNYIPWLGYFDLVRQASIMVWYDDVQYTKRDWRNRNRVAGAAAPEWLTIPVKTRGHFDQRICEVEIDDTQPWVRRHLGTLRRCYGGAPYYDVVQDIVVARLGAGYRLLSDLTIAVNEAICEVLGLRPLFVRSSQLPRKTLDRQERLIEICRQLAATTYLSGPAARAYIEPQRFAKADLDLRYVVYDYPPYPRGEGPFLPKLSVIDALAWLGPDRTAAFLASHGDRTVAA
jgi:hypothetical protein